MNFYKISAISLLSVFLSACGSGGNGNPAVVGLNLPANVEVLQDDSASSASLAAVSSAVYNDPGTDYTNTKIVQIGIA